MTNSKRNLRIRFDEDTLNLLATEAERRGITLSGLVAHLANRWLPYEAKEIPHVQERPQPKAA